MRSSRPAVNLNALDDATAALVRLSAVITAGTEVGDSQRAGSVAPFVPPVWVEELLLQIVSVRRLSARAQRHARVAASASRPGVALSASHDVARVGGERAR